MKPYNFDRDKRFFLQTFEQYITVRVHVTLLEQAMQYILQILADNTGPTV